VVSPAMPERSHEGQSERDKRICLNVNNSHAQGFLFNLSPVRRGVEGGETHSASFAVFWSCVRVVAHDTTASQDNVTEAGKRGGGDGAARKKRLTTR